MYRWMPGSTCSNACSTIIGEQWFMAEFRHYRAFVEIAVRGSFTAGAQAPHVTQSTISEQTAGLEKELGTRLFDRGRHGACLTKSAQRQLESAQQLLRMCRPRPPHRIRPFRHPPPRRRNRPATALLP